MRLNLGCGFNKIEGHINVDKEALCRPDVTHDLESFPWPWPDDSIDEIVAHHALEHLGATVEAWIGILKEIWRVGKSDCQLLITVPHPRHDNFIHDPTHVRIITPTGIAMFDQQRNIANFEAGGDETKLGLFNGIDFEVLATRWDLMEPWHSRYMNGELDPDQIERDIAHLSNVCSQIQITVRVVKPARGRDWTPDRNVSAPVPYRLEK